VTDVTRPAVNPAHVPSDPIVFYDADCGFCNASVQFVLRHERAPVLLFAPIEGITATQANIPPGLGQQTIIVLESGRQYIRSRAAARILMHMGGGWRLLAGVLVWIPRPLADLAYRVIARFRKKLPGARSCTLPTSTQRARFLD